MVNPSRPSESRLLSATLRTTRSILDEALVARVPRETIRFWEDRSPWRKSPYPLWRVYAETLPDSAATGRLTRSSTYRQISRAELEDAVGLSTARKFRTEWGAAASEHEAPVLVIFVGADESILQERFEAADDSRKRAYAKLGNMIYDPKGCSVSSIVVQSNVPVEDLLPDLAGRLPFALRS